MARTSSPEIPVIDPKQQIAKGVDDDMRSYFAAQAIDLCLPWEFEPDNPSHSLMDSFNDTIREEYPDGPTPDILGKGSWFELNVKSHQERRKAIFKGLGGITTLALLGSADMPYDVDYFRETIINDEGELRTRTAWELGREIPAKYLEMFNLVPPPEKEVALHTSRTICFYDNGDYFFPVFQFGGQEGDSKEHYINAVDRILGLEGKYPSHSAMLEWTTRFKGTGHPLHEFVREENFDSNKLWDIYWQSLGNNPRNIFGGPSALSNDDGRPPRSVGEA